MMMELPLRIDLPFFAYGLFRPGQLGFLRVKQFVVKRSPGIVRGDVLVRDGLPIADAEGVGAIGGSLLFFKNDAAAGAYQRIVEIEPGHQYRWGTADAGGSQCNLLWGKSPKKGSVPIDAQWDGREDPLFTSALDVVDEVLRDQGKFEWDLKLMFRLQMAYLLLWSAIERYASLRYHLGDKAFEKVKHLASERAFVAAVQAAHPNRRHVFRADRPSELVRFDPARPDGFIGYYYQLRSNVVHRGKGLPRDHERIHEALSELLPAFRAALKQAFDESTLDA